MVNQSFTDPIIMNRIANLIDNASLSRSRLSGDHLNDKRRSIADECGFPDSSELTAHSYKQMYDRDAIAARVVDVMPEESWQVQPLIQENEEIGVITEFEKDWRELDRNFMRLEPSYFEDDENQGSPIIEFLTRAHKLSGISRYGIILFGFNDGRKLNEPLTIPKNGGGLKLLYLRTFDESLAEITEWDNKLTSTRNGKPTMYKVNIGGSVDDGYSGLSSPQGSQLVHWTRIQHIAPTLLSSEVFAVPEMQQVYNNLLGLQKLYGASPEMYWKGAFPGISWETHPSLGGDVTIDKAAFRDEVEQLQNTLQRSSVTAGLHANSLAPQVVDPSPQIDVQLTAICIKKGIPKRKFMGTERGELSSTQDDGDWNDLLRAVQHKINTPKIVVPFVNKLINYGVLSKPERFSVDWHDTENVNDMDRATIAVKMTESLVKFIAGGGEAMMHPVDFLVKAWRLSPDEAVSVLKRANDGVGGVPDLDLDKARESIKGSTHTNDPNLKMDPATTKEKRFSKTTISNLDNDYTYVGNEFNLSPSELAVVKARYEESINDNS